MGNTVNTVCIDREKVYGILNKNNQSIPDLCREWGLNYSSVYRVVSRGKITEDFLDDLSYALAVEPADIKGRSSVDAGPEEIEYKSRNGRDRKKSWSKIDGDRLKALIYRKFGARSITWYAGELGMSKTTLQNYIEDGEVPTDKLNKIASSLDTTPVYLTGEVDLHLEDVKDTVVQTSENTYISPVLLKTATENSRTSDSDPTDYIQTLLDKIQDLEVRLSKYENTKVIAKDSYEANNVLVSHLVHALKSKGFSDEDISYVCDDTMRCIYGIADFALGNYTRKVFDKRKKKGGLIRNKSVEVDENAYGDFLNKIVEMFVDVLEDQSYYSRPKE